MNGRQYKCILFELLGESLEYLFYEENDDIITLELFKKVIYDIIYGLNQIHKKSHAAGARGK